MADAILSAEQVGDADLNDWSLKDDTLHARFEPEGFSAGARLALRVAAAADAADHHPEIDLRYGEVHVRLSSHDVGGVTERDIRLAHRISELAEQEGIVERGDEETPASEKSPSGSDGSADFDDS